jgi:hypothetical protein
MTDNERDVLAEALSRATVRMREAAIGEGTLSLCLAMVRDELSGYTLSRSEPDRKYWCGGPQNGQPQPHRACNCTLRPAAEGSARDGG